MTPAETAAPEGHTPGPWVADGAPWNQIIWSGPESRVCFMAHSDGRSVERDIANARLIAAAPDLLAHLQFAVKLLRPFGHTAQVQAMEEVIAKATGKDEQ